MKDERDFLPPGMEAVFTEVQHDPYSRDTDALLRSLGIASNIESKSALLHILNRPPRRGEVPHWKVVASKNPRAFRDGWLSASVWHRLCDLERKLVTDVVKVVSADETEARAEADTEALLLEPGDDQALETLIAAAGLTPRQRDIYLPHEVEKQRLVQIARDLGIAETTARNTYGRCRQKLAQTDTAKRAGVGQKRGIFTA